MKKLIAIVSVFILSMTLAACGGQTDELNVYSRDAASGTREAFEKGIGFDDDKDTLAEQAIVVSGNGDMATKVGNDEKGIGYVSLSTDMNANNLQTVKFEGIEPTVANVLNDSYKLSRPFSYTTRAADDFESDAHKNMTLAFIAYLGTRDGMALIEEAGGIVDDSGADTWSEIKDDYPVCTGDTVTIKMGGSTSVEKTITKAADGFKSDCAAFNYEGNHTGSSDGYKRTLGEEKDSNYADLGFASRPFGSDEDVSNASDSGAYATDAVAVVISKDNDEITNITAEQLYKIYTGDITTWVDLTE